MVNHSLPSSELRPDDQRFISLAAMFQKEFRVDWVARLSGNDVTLSLSILQRFMMAGVLESPRPGFYHFREEEERLAILDQLGSEDKETCNQHIIALFASEPLDNDEKAVYLYSHLLQTEPDVSGCFWLKRAGDVFRKNSRLELARICYQKTIESLAPLHGDIADTLFMDTAISHSKVFMAAKETSKIITILESALDRTKDENGDLGRKALLKMELAKNEWLRSRYHIAMQYFQEGKAIAEKTGDERILRKTALYNIYYYFWQGRIKDIINEYENYQPEVAGFPQNQFLLRTVGLAAQAYAHAGQINQALGMIESLQHYAEEIGDHQIRCNTQGFLAGIMQNMGKIDEAFRFDLQCLELSERMHVTWMTYHTKLRLAHLSYLRGDHTMAVGSLKDFERLREKLQVYVPVLPTPLMDLCWAIESGKLNYKAGFTMTEILQESLQGENIFTKGLAYRYSAFMKERQGASIDEVFRDLLSSVKWLEAAGALVEMAKSQLEIARRRLDLQNVDGARDMTLKASRVLIDVNPDLIPKNLINLISAEGSKRNMALDEILKLGQEIADIRESRALVLKIISVVNHLTGAERGAIFILEGGDLKFKASQNITKSQTAEPGFADSMNIIRDVIRTGQGCIKEMNTGYPNPASAPDSIIRSIICVPMILRGQVIGVLYHDNCFISSIFKDADLGLLGYFAAQAAISFENVSSYEKMQALNQKLSQEKEHLEERYLNRVHWGNIIGTSRAIRGVLDKIDKVSRTDSSVLILGETGSGKELVANAVHQNSHHRDGPFIVVQCSAMPENLIQSELFGHEKGAFTGALKKRLGRIELANGGTLFLDEIGDLSPEVQVGLLRVLQSRRFERVGGNETLQSEFRLIAATNRDLEQSVQEGRFRADLYYRINVFPIHVPPLREREEDIPLLANHFLALHSKKLGKDFQQIHEKALSCLVNYKWPGNIRELENTLERAMILDQPPILNIVDLPPGDKNRKCPGMMPKSDPEMSLIENERLLIIAALEKTGWQISGSEGAAEILKINPSTLRFRIKKLGIRKP